jgi:hypothetical protein
VCSDAASVAVLATTLFEQMRAHTLKNVVLKFQVSVRVRCALPHTDCARQCFFVNRCASELATAIHGALAVMNDADIEELFQVLCARLARCCADCAGAAAD